VDFPGPVKPNQRTGDHLNFFRGAGGGNTVLDERSPWVTPNKDSQRASRRNLTNFGPFGFEPTHKIPLGGDKGQKHGGYWRGGHKTNFRLKTGAKLYFPPKGKGANF